MVLEMARKIKRKHDVPVVVMTYYNPVFRMGLKPFFSYAKECLVDGLIVPDLPVEEAADYVKMAQAQWCGHDFSRCAINFNRASRRRSWRVVQGFSISSHTSASQAKSKILMIQRFS